MIHHRKHTQRTLAQACSITIILRDRSNISITKPSSQTPLSSTLERIRARLSNQGTGRTFNSLQPHPNNQQWHPYAEPPQQASLQPTQERSTGSRSSTSRANSSKAGLPFAQNNKNWEARLFGIPHQSQQDQQGPPNHRASRRGLHW